MTELITLNDVIKCIIPNFPFNKVEQTKYPNIFKFYSDTIPYYVNIKVPDKNDIGKAIHVNIRIQFDKFKDYNVYPLKSEKKGRGHFISKSIARTKNWKEKLMDEINIGIKIAIEKYNLKK